MAIGRSAEFATGASSVALSSTRLGAAARTASAGRRRATGARFCLGRTVTRLADGRALAEPDHGAIVVDIESSSVIDAHGLIGAADLKREAGIGVEADLAVHRGED